MKKWKLRSNFTLIELLVSVTCQVCVLPLHYLKKQSKKMPYNACEASASCTESALHICRRQMLHTFVCLTRQRRARHKVLHNTAFSDEAATLCSAMKHLLFANMKHKHLKSLV